MDTKKLFLKTQMNLINWGLFVAFFYALLMSFYFMNSPKTFTVTLTFFIGALLFLSALFTRITLKPKVAMLAMGALATQLLIGLIDSALRFKSLVEMAKNFPQTKITFFFSLFLGYAIYILALYLYYKVYKATCYIKELKQV